MLHKCDGRLTPRSSLLLGMVVASVAFLVVLPMERVAAATGGDCDLVVSPSLVEVGQSFWVSGNFDDAEIHQVVGMNVALPEDSQAVAFAAPDKGSFRFRFSAERSEVGFLTIWAIVVGTECSDSAVVQIVRDLPDTAMRQAPLALVQSIGIMLIVLALILSWRGRRGRT